MKKNIILVTSVISMFLISGCVETGNERIRAEISKHETSKKDITLGDEKYKVVKILDKLQQGFDKSLWKNNESYIKDSGVVVDIYYAMSHWVNDGLKTDDEYTPYVFNNNRLVAIGWASIGGAKTQGQVRKQTIVMPIYDATPLQVYQPLSIPSYPKYTTY